MSESLVYATVDGTELKLDIHRAPGEGAPVVVYLHGGGWSHGDRRAEAGRRQGPLAALGVTVVSVDYRLAPSAVYPAQVHDVKGAVRWLRANGARLGLATERLGVWGASAGAYLASLLALSPGELEGTVGGNADQSSAVQAVVHWFGQADLAATAGRSELEERLLPFHFEADFLGGADPAGLSLLARVSPGAPPFLIAHGDRDRIVPPAEGQALHDALVRAGASSRFELLGGAGHEDEAFDRPAHLATTAAWLRAVLA